MPDTDGEWHGTHLSVLDLGLCDVVDADMGVVRKPVVYELLYHVGICLLENLHLHWNIFSSLPVY